MDTPIYTRLKQIRKHMNMSQGQFARMLGIGQSTLGMMEVGKREILERHIKTISAVCGVSEEWLRTGEGEMLKSGKSFSLDEYARVNGLSALELDIIKTYMELPPKTRQAALALLRQMFGRSPEEAEIALETASYKEELRAEKFTATASASPEPKDA